MTQNVVLFPLGWGAVGKQVGNTNPVLPQESKLPLQEFTASAGAPFLPLPQRQVSQIVSSLSPLLWRSFKDVSHTKRENQFCKGADFLFSARTVVVGFELLLPPIKSPLKSVQDRSGVNSLSP